MIKKSKKEYQKEYRLKNKEHIREYKKEYRLKNKEHIKKQQKEYCLKNCEHIKKRNREYNLKNCERNKEQMREYYLKTKEKKREYYLKNHEHFKKYKREYGRKRYKTDINYRIRQICKTRILQALKGLNKSASTMKLIGCTVDELRRHIESQFKPGMNWENQGLRGWDMDHIKACFHFNLEDPKQQRACFNWSNLQPMEHIANIKKGARC